jgi:hypothetical protein
MEINAKKINILILPLSIKFFLIPLASLEEKKVRNAP